MCGIFIFGKNRLWMFMLRCSHFFNLSILFYHCDQGQWYASLFFNNIGHNIFLCPVCCNLVDIFFKCCAMFSDLYACLQQWPSTLFLHATLTSKMSFLYSGIQRLPFFLKCNRTVMEASMLYIASGFIVQGYSPYKCIKCTCCIHSKGTFITKPIPLAFVLCLVF